MWQNILQCLRCDKNMENCKINIKLENSNMMCIEFDITCIEIYKCSNKQVLLDMMCNINCLEISSNLPCNWYNEWHSYMSNIKIDMSDTFLYCFRHRFLVDSLRNKSYCLESILVNIMCNFQGQLSYILCINLHKFYNILKYYDIPKDTS